MECKRRRLLKFPLGVSEDMCQTEVRDLDMNSNILYTYSSFFLLVFLYVASNYFASLSHT